MCSRLTTPPRWAQRSGTIGSRILNVTSSLSAWSVSPSLNKGWLIRYSGTNGTDLRSSEYATASVRPKLVVYYNISNLAPDQPVSDRATQSGDRRIDFAVAAGECHGSGFGQHDGDLQRSSGGGYSAQQLRRSGDESGCTVRFDHERGLAGTFAAHGLRVVRHPQRRWQHDHGTRLDVYYSGSGTRDHLHGSSGGGGGSGVQLRRRRLGCSGSYVFAAGVPCGHDDQSGLGPDCRGPRATAGDFNVSVQALNSVGSDTQSYAIHVTEVPQITSTAVVAGIVGQLYSYDVNATGSPAPTYRCWCSPAGMTINPASGLIAWTPGAAGDFNVSVQALNTAGSDTQSYAIHVTRFRRCRL